ncbi:DUF6919 domain-containing protein [Streptomyces syringium]|uniref:DUF6919 domain-containing protein n=1 Tax=Streptomyces syringium TaxID=76729 RepID=UPI0037D6F05D
MKLPWMSRSDRRRWKAASTLAELGQLMALWLEGAIGSRPGYQPRYGPDEETAELIPTLVACNRAGFVTDVSQPGLEGDAWDGSPWNQRAAVQGFIGDEDLLHRVMDAAQSAGLQVIVHGPGFTDLAGPTIVTTWDGEDYTAFGEKIPARHLRVMFGGCNRRAVRAVSGSWQVAIIDPVWGRDDVLWPALDAAIGRTAATKSPEVAA